MTLAPMATANSHPEIVATADSPRWVRVFRPAIELANGVSDTEFVPEALRGRPDKIAACVLYGDELGVGPMQALAGIHVIKGKPSPSAELVRALVFGAGHSISIDELSGQRCTVTGRRSTGETLTLTWDMDMARAAGLPQSNQNYTRYPRGMLLARATMDVARYLFPDAMRGLSHVGDDDVSAREFDAWASTVPDGNDRSEAPPSSGTVTRRRPGRRASTSHVPASGVTSKEIEDVALPETPAPAGGRTETPSPVSVDPAPPAGPDGNVGAVWYGRNGADDLPATPQQPPDDGYVPAGQVDTDPERLGDDTFLERSRTRMHAGFTAMGASRDLRLAITSAALGRSVTTSKHLSRLDVLKVVGVLNQLETGVLDYRVIDPHGAVELVPTGEEPPPDD